MSIETIISQFLKETIKLPEGMSFYEVDGRILFPVKNENGKFILYLTAMKVDKAVSYGITFNELFKSEIDNFTNQLKEGS